MAKLWCWLFGHDWIWVGTYHAGLTNKTPLDVPIYVCPRCGHRTNKKHEDTLNG